MEFSSNVFSTTDIAVFGLMLAISVGIGVYTSIRGGGSSTQQYLLGGRNMSPIPVALSLLGGKISAISILGNATEVYFFGTQISIVLVGFIIGTVILIKITLPILYNLKITSIHEYLELRYKNSAIRKLTTSTQLLIMSCYMAMCLYAPSLVLSTVTNLSTFASMAIMGSISTFYITIGGVKAVVYTDVLQTLLMFGGVLVVAIVCCIDLGGIQEVWIRAQQGQRLQFFNMDPNPYIRHTFCSTLVLGIFTALSVVGFDQSTYQRFASVSTISTAKKLCWFFLVGLWMLWIPFLLCGLVAYAVYQDCDPLKAGYITKPDQIMPFLVTNKLGHIPGMSGIFVASIYGAVLSSLSSSGNSMACLIWQDFLSHLPYFSKLSDQAATNIMKILSCLSGLLAVCLGLIIGNLGTIFHVINIILSAFGGPMIGIFLSGMIFPWTNAKGSLLGFASSFSFLGVLMIGKFIRGGGSPTMLPLSNAHCPNATLNPLNTTILFNNTQLQNGTNFYVTTEVAELDQGLHESEIKNTLYDLSYCYTGAIGILLTMLISAITSIFMGPTKPKDLCKGVVHPLCEHLYKKLWWGDKSSTEECNNKGNE